MKGEDNQFPYVTVSERASKPAPPAAGDQRLYLKTNHRLYGVDSSDTETEIGQAYTDAAILAGAPGGATVSDQVLKAWTESKAFEMLTVTYDATYPSLIASATVQWPDGSAGTLTITSTDTTKLAELSYTITHTASGKTVTQAAVTLNANGYVTVKPALTVA